jgi:hypothetical protein
VQRSAALRQATGANGSLQVHYTVCRRHHIQPADARLAFQTDHLSHRPRMSMVYYREGQVQRHRMSMVNTERGRFTAGFKTHRVRKPNCTGPRGHERRHHRFVPSQKRTHVRLQEKRQDQLEPHRRHYKQPADARPTSLPNRPPQRMSVAIDGCFTFLSFTSSRNRTLAGAQSHCTRAEH